MVTSSAKALDLLTRDLAHIATVYSKYGLQPCSWYWRDAERETREAWISRRVARSLHVGAYTGVWWLGRRSCKFIIPLESHERCSDSALLPGSELEEAMLMFVDDAGNVTRGAIPVEALFDMLEDWVDREMSR